MLTVKSHQSELKMDESLFFKFCMNSSRVRKRKSAFFYEDLSEAEPASLEEDCSNETIDNVARLVCVLSHKERKQRGVNRDRNLQKMQWDDLYRNRSKEEFVEKMRITRDTFNLILNALYEELLLKPSNFLTEPTSPDRQLAETLYRLAHVVTYTVLEDILEFQKNQRVQFFKGTVSSDKIVLQLIVDGLYITKTSFFLSAEILLC